MGIVSAVLALAACADSVQRPTAPPLSQVTHSTPAPASPVAQQRGAEVRRVMWKLANTVGALQQTLASTQPAAERGAAVAGLLAQMEDNARELLGHGGAVDHPLFDARLADLVAEAGEARKAAAGTPPDFAPADTLVGACASCHAFPGSP